MATRSWIIAGPRRDDVPGVSALRVQLVAGSVDVVVHDAPHAHLEVLDVVGNPLEAKMEGERLTVGYPFLGWEGWAKRLRSFRSTDTARLRVHVPAGTTVDVATATADGSVTGVREDVSLMTATGHLSATGCRGSATLRSASGLLEAIDHDGPVRATTAAGRAVVAGALPRVEITSVTGAVDVTTTLATSMVDLSTVSATMDVAVPFETGLSLTARGIAGGVQVDGVDRRSPGFGTTTVEDMADGGTCFLTTKTVSGGLSVRRARPGEPVGGILGTAPAAAPPPPVAGAGTTPPDGGQPPTSGGPTPPPGGPIPPGGPAPDPAGPTPPPAPPAEGPAAGPGGPAPLPGGPDEDPPYRPGAPR